MEKLMAIQTNGIGQKCTNHLNLTTTLADVWKCGPVEVVLPAPSVKRKTTKPTFKKIRFAGQE